MTNISRITEDLESLTEKAQRLSEKTAALEAQLAAGQAQDPLILGITVFMLACFVGYYVVWRVTPALHTPLMSVTNAISGIIVVGAIIALGPESGDPFSRFLGFLAVMLASVNIFGGFTVTQRMLEMYRKKEKRPGKGSALP